MAPGIRAAEMDVALFMMKRSCTWESAMFSAWRCQASLKAKDYMRRVAAKKNRDTLLVARIFISWYYGTASYSRQRGEVANRRSDIGVQASTATASEQQVHVNRNCELESQVRGLLQRLQQSEQRVNESEAENASNKRRADEAEWKIKLKESSVAPKSQRGRFAEWHIIALARWCLGTWHCVASTQIALRAQVATASASEQQVHVNRNCELESQIRGLLQRLQQSEQRVNESEAENASNKRRADEAEQKTKLKESSVSDRIAEWHRIALTRWCLGTWLCVASTQIALRTQVATATASEQQFYINRMCELESQVRGLLQRLQQSDQRVNESEAENASNKRWADEAERKIKLMESSAARKSQRDRITEWHIIALARWCLGTWHCVASMQIALRAQQHIADCNAIALEEARETLEFVNVNRREVARLAEMSAWERAVASIAEAECSMQDSLGGTFDTHNQIFHAELSREAADFAADEIGSSRESVREALIAADDARKCREELHAMQDEVNTKACLFVQYQNECAEQEAMLMARTQACREAYMKQTMHETNEVQSCRVAMQMLRSELQECRVHADQRALSVDEALSVHMAREQEVQSSRHMVQQLQRKLQWSDDRINELTTALRIAEADAGQANQEINLLRNSIAQLQSDIRKVKGDTNLYSQSHLTNKPQETLRLRARQWIRRISAALEAGQKYRLMQSCFMAWRSDYILEMRLKLENGTASKDTLGLIREENQELRRQCLVHLQAAGYSNQSREEMLTKSLQAALATLRMHADLSIAAKRCAAAREIAEAWEHEQQDCINATAEVVAISERLAITELFEESQRDELELEVARDLQNQEIEIAISQHLATVEASISERLVHAESSHLNEPRVANPQRYHRQCVQSSHVIFANINRMFICSERTRLKFVVNLWRLACQSEMSVMAKRHWAHGNVDDFVSQPFRMLDVESHREAADLDSPTPSVNNLPAIEAQLADTSFARDGFLHALDELPDISSSLSEDTEFLHPPREGICLVDVQPPVFPRVAYTSELMWQSTSV